MFQSAKYSASLIIQTSIIWTQAVEMTALLEYFV